jgi:SAM-dependent methyltransferase
MTEPDFRELKDRTRQLWAIGDYQKIAGLILPAARSLTDACAISAGQEVLDVAAGNGNLAVLAAEEGADVVASDIAPAQVELGRARTEAEGLDVEWHEADAEELPFDDARFDCAASVFGVMFAPRPEVAIGEMFRVVKPGGTVGIAAWGPYGSQGEMFAEIRRFGPPLPEGVPDPSEWGVEEMVEQRVGPLASSLSMERRTMHWEFDSFDQAWETLGAAGPGAALRKVLPPEKLDEMFAGARAVAERHNRGEGGRVVLDPEYLEIVARKRG